MALVTAGCGCNERDSYAVAGSALLLLISPHEVREHSNEHGGRKLTAYHLSLSTESSIVESGYGNSKEKVLVLAVPLLSYRKCSVHMLVAAPACCRCRVVMMWEPGKRWIDR